VDILVETGLGLITANAYASVAEVDDILSVNIHSTWSILDEPTKANLIMWATRLLDTKVRWYGDKMYRNSALAWPRENVRDADGFPIDDNIVPRQVKLATALLADHLVTGNPELVNSSTNLTSLKADVIELKFDANLQPAKYPVEIRLVLAGLGTVSMGRGGPKRIIKH
jgi:hypothetical protein